MVWLGKTEKVLKEAFCLLFVQNCPHVLLTGTRSMSNEQHGAGGVWHGCMACSCGKGMRDHCDCITHVNMSGVRSNATDFKFLMSSTPCKSVRTCLASNGIAIAYFAVRTIRYGWFLACVACWQRSEAACGVNDNTVHGVVACDSRQTVKLKPAGWAHAFPCGMPRMKRECSGLVTLHNVSKLLGLVERHDLGPQHTCDLRACTLHHSHEEQVLVSSPVENYGGICASLATSRCSR